jgi:hypothetical protein
MRSVKTAVKMRRHCSCGSMIWTAAKGGVGRCIDVRRGKDRAVRASDSGRLTDTSCGIGVEFGRQRQYGTR